jgi:hypothetical protein
VMSADSYAHQVCGLRPSRSSPYRPHYRYRQWLTAVNSLAVVIHMRLIPSFLGDQIVRYRVVDKANASAGNFTLTERKSRGDALPAFTPRIAIRLCVGVRVIRRKLLTHKATDVRGYPITRPNNGVPKYSDDKAAENRALHHWLGIVSHPSLLPSPFEFSNNTASWRTAGRAGWTKT